MAEGVCLLSNCVVTNTTGSNPVFSANPHAHVAKLADASGLGSDLSEVQVQVLSCAKAFVDQWIDRQATDLKDEGSNPSERAPYKASTWWLSG